MLTVLSIFGTRPEAIKMAPLVKQLQQNPGLRSLTAVTAQHREMLDQVLSIFQINPDFDLDLMQPRQSLTEITCRALSGLEKVLHDAAADLVLVHGDTTTTLAAALAAFYQNIAVGHVEAGLRTHCKLSPYPEEINRRLTAALADLHFAPTALAKQNLLAENIAPEQIFVTGNTVIDALKSTVNQDYIFPDDRLNRIDFANPVLLAEVHRRENWGSPLEEILSALRRLVEDLNIQLIFPVHPNPQVREPVERLLRGRPGILLLEPLDVITFHNLLNRCYLVITDSGGLQEEAPALGKPVIVVRNNTERPEAVAAGTVQLAGRDASSIYRATRGLLDSRPAYCKMARAVNPYGDGNASRRISEAILYYFRQSSRRPPDFTP